MEEKNGDQEKNSQNKLKPGKPEKNIDDDIKDESIKGTRITPVCTNVYDPYIYCKRVFFISFFYIILL